MSDASALLHLADRVLAPRWGWRWRAAVIVAAAATCMLAASLADLFLTGVGVWGNDWPVVWAFDILNYVWWVGIASGGTLVSSLLFLVGAQWRNALNRIAETMTLFALACAGIYPLIHLGRPWHAYWLFPSPNTMQIYAQPRSPLVWDFSALLAYVIGSILFWWLGLLPDAATLRDRARTRGLATFWAILSLGWTGSARQWRAWRAGYALVAACMTPLVISVHSIVGLDFAAGILPGWHSTQFPPFFVAGALLSGIASVLAMALLLRWTLSLDRWITATHLDRLAKLLLAAACAVGYAYLLEALQPFWTGDGAEKTNFLARAFGPLAPLYWATVLCNVALPQLFWWPRWRRSTRMLASIALLAIAGMWIERFLIVAGSLMRDRLPSSWGTYTPTWIDWSTLIGTVGLFALGMLIAARLVPMQSLAEQRARGDGA